MCRARRLCVVDVAGKFGRELSGKGEAAMIDFAINWLAGLYGTDFKRHRQAPPRHALEPRAVGARRRLGRRARRAAVAQDLMEPLSNRIFFAGEAAHETLWGTVGGAWESGERAADAALQAAGAARRAGQASSMSRAERR